MERMSLDVNKMTKDQLKQHILMLAMQLTQLEEENKKLKEEIATLKMYLSKEENVYCLTKENRDLVEKIEKLLWEKIKLEEEIRSPELENRAMKVESEDLKMWLREKLPSALLKEYMEKFEGVDLKNV